mmetsp:Transcript_18966/g.30190  ORF Transcript_18966/g.30190 Transcript_18966/m.30190 type:complete len:487 (-) Transcript_18966:287-1747(-)|eukprot:CAMPEP_0202696212 /NCGR_PEP_ID=MMETSP1385-20130828/9519_1 /ASSEMBLY_ACC=CAM_ASM_000861 /TAXON_ID=933848 /ORGANISM="Elphidium margaritaceum" /LENGTH=486 /DNA_ID=CAMNT_0049352329 /DNA_START=43 /DNA_END=1503 /DNA_ORIENTATION=+
MATNEQEMAPLNPQQDAEAGQALVSVVPDEKQPEEPANGAAAPPKKIRQQEPAELFRWKLKENDGCCSAWCTTIFFLVYLLLTNVVNIIIAGYHLKILTDPYGTHTICYYPSTGSESACTEEDARIYYEEFGLSVTFLIIELIFLAVYTLTTIASLHALHKCIPWVFMVLWVCINTEIIFILLHSLLTGIYWGIFALLLPMLFSCYFWMIYQLANYFAKGGIYDQDMNMSPSPNNYAVMYVARPQDLAHYHAQYKKRDTEPIDSKKLFRMKMNEGFEFCCCMCTMQMWSIIWLVYMICQNLLWFSASVVTTVILYDPVGTWMDCLVYNGSEVTTADCRLLFEEYGLTRGFSIVACIVAGIAVIINVWCWVGLYKMDRNAFMSQVTWLLVQAFFMVLYSVFTGYYFGIFAILIPLLLSCHYYNVYIVCVYCEQRINTSRIPKMQAVIIADQNEIIYVSAPKPDPVKYVNDAGQPLVPPTIEPVQPAQ